MEEDLSFGIDTINGRYGYKDSISGSFEEFKERIKLLFDLSKKEEREDELDMGMKARNKYLREAKELFTYMASTSQELLTLIQDLQKQEDALKEENKKFPPIEKKVLKSLSPVRAKWIKKMRSCLFEYDKEDMNAAYRQAIMKLHTGEAIIHENTDGSVSAVEFVNEHILLEGRELQLTIGENVFNESYNGKKVVRNQVKQEVLDEDHKDHFHIIDIQKKLKDDGKYIITVDNGLGSILDGFHLDEIEKKIISLQVLLGFEGVVIVSLERDKDGRRNFLKFGRGKNYVYLGVVQDPARSGSFLVAKNTNNG